MLETGPTAVKAFESLSVMITNTCINYQTILPPVLGEHMAFGDTGVVIYCNALMGARSNFEGGPSALAAGLTGRTPRYGYHLDRNRKGTKHFVVDASMASLSDWGALGGIIGKAVNSYWEVPVISGIESPPSSDQMKHFGASLASFGSAAMLHMPGITPEARDLRDAFHGLVPSAETRIGTSDLANFYARYDCRDENADVVVFAASQLSLMEMEQVARMIDGRSVHPETTLLVATSPEIKSASCFYQSYARELAEANGWKRLVTNSAKLVNIIGGYGYHPTLLDTQRCTDSAVLGKIVQ